MKNRLILFALVFFLFNFGNIYGQKFLSIISYSMGEPLGNTADYVGEYSWTGFSIEGRTFTQRNISFGILFGLNYFDERTDETFEIENGAVTGTQIRYMDVIPIMATAHYYFGKRRKKSMRVFAGLDLGTYIITERFDIGIWSFRKNNWHLGVAPELGVLVPLGSSSLALSVKYNYAFDSGETFFGNNDNSHSFININVGFGFGY